jgi:vitamin B12 transporter
MAQLFTANVFADNELKTSDVFVTATRTPISKNNVIADVTTIYPEEIERAGSSSLPELLQRQPGVEISNLGGAGKVSTLSLRGTSSTHSIVLIDGMRVGAATSGFSAIEHIPLSQIEKIEILRGPASSLYGQDAIGGVIQIFTKKGVDGFKPYVGIGYGSYNTSNFQSGIRGGNNQTTYAINFAAMNTGGFSAFIPNPNNTSGAVTNAANLDKDGYKNYSLSSSLNHKINQDYEIDFQYFLSKGKNKFDQRYADFSPFVDFKNEARQESYGLNLKGQINNAWQSSIKIGQSTDKYLDKQKFNPAIGLILPDPPPDGCGGPCGAQDSTLVDLYKTTQNQFAWQNNIKLNKGSLTLLYDFLEQKIKTTDLYEKTQRTNHGLMVGYGLIEDKHNFQTNFRKDFNSAYDDAVTGNIGYAYSINSNWTITSSFGTAFVSPSFNYLYSLADTYALGNPNLKPEKSKNIEGSIRYKDDSGSMSLTMFQNKIDDFIIYSNPYPNITRTSTQNLNKAEIQGLTISGDQFLGHFQIKGGMTFQSAKNEDTDLYLPRRAKTFGNINFNYYIGSWNVGVEETYSDKRFDNKENTVKLSGYALTNIVAGYKINDKLNLNLRLNNVFDKDYSLAAEGASGFRYQTPGRSLFANLRYDF